MDAERDVDDDFGLIALLLMTLWTDLMEAGR
jgi:hypothetical protein